MKSIVIAGNGQAIGKTFISAIIVQALEADYWKPVQAGNLDNTDTDFVRQHTSNSVSRFYPEGYQLSTPMSPHAAAAEGLIISLSALCPPSTRNHLVIELGGSLMDPLTNKQLNIDLLEQWGLPVVYVCHNYLESNHTLLALEVLKRREINVAALIFNGIKRTASEDFIMQYTGLPCLAKIDIQPEITRDTVVRLATEVKGRLNRLFI